MVPDIVEIKRLCSSGQWNARIENGKILLHNTVAGETVCIGQTDAEPVRHGRWEWKDGAAYCTAHKGKISPDNYGYGYCPLCGARMDGGK